MDPFCWSGRSAFRNERMQSKYSRNYRGCRNGNTSVLPLPSITYVSSKATWMRRQLSMTLVKQVHVHGDYFIR